VARELVILPRFKRDYRKARKHAKFDAETRAMRERRRVEGLRELRPPPRARRGRDRQSPASLERGCPSQLISNTVP
jgi:hypothetical protein